MLAIDSCQPNVDVFSSLSRLDPVEVDMSASSKGNEAVFKDLGTNNDSDALGPTEVESLCMSCGENGTTRILLTKIPHYKEVILMSFSCGHCGLENNEVQSGGKVSDQGVLFDVVIRDARDLSRQVVKSDVASITVPEIELEIPPNSQNGSITTVEGLLRRTIAALDQDQPARRVVDAESADKIAAFIGKIEDLLSNKVPFHIILSDPSGNSFIENINAPGPDPSRRVTWFTRTKDQDRMLGIYTDYHAEPDTIEEQPEAEAEAEVNDDVKDEVLKFPTNCPECNAPAETNMKVTSIPFFKDVVIMATVCDSCGHKTNEVKSGGGIEDKGTRVTLRVTDASDLSRDVLKSEMCTIMIPELEFEMGGHALGGRFTTLEGLLQNILDQVQNNPIAGGALTGDAASDETTERYEQFSRRLTAMFEGRQLPFTFVMDDPSGNSYLQNVYAPDPDPEMTVQLYERTWEQNEIMGLNDMKVEGYEER